MEMRQLKQKNIAGILVFWELCKIDKNVLETVCLYQNIRYIIVQSLEWTKWEIKVYNLLKSYMVVKTSKNT